MKRVMTIILVLAMAVVGLYPAGLAVAEPSDEPTTTQDAGSTDDPDATPTDDADTTMDIPEDAEEGDYPPYNTDPERYKLEVDVTNCVVTVFERDENGLYTEIVRQFIMTSGDAENKTPTGVFTIGAMRERFGYFLNFNVYAQYWTQVVNGVYFHSVLYSRREEGTMQGSSYRNLGRNVSHGCIRLLVEDARWIYYNIPAGTICNVTTKERDSALTQSLKPKGSASTYSPTPDPNPDPEPEYAYCNADNVPISTGFFGPKDRGIGSLNRGDKVEVTQRGKEYLKIRKEDGGEGYTYARYFQSDEPGPIEIKDGEIGIAHTRRAYKLYNGPEGEYNGYSTYKNADYYIEEIVGDYFKIRMGDVSGYLPIKSADFLTYPEDTEFLVVSKVRAEKLSMYAAPDSSSAVIDKMDYGDEGRIFQYGGKWSLIRCRGQFGYVQSEYISVILSKVEQKDDEEQHSGVMPSEVDPEIDPETVNDGGNTVEEPSTNTGDE